MKRTSDKDELPDSRKQVYQYIIFLSRVTIHLVRAQTYQNGLWGGGRGTVYCWQNLFVLKEISTILILIFSASTESSSNMCTNSYHKLRLNISPVISSYRPFCASFRVMKISAKYDFYWSVSCLKFLNNVTSFTMLKWKARFVIFKALCKAMSRRRHFDNKHLDPNLSA